MFYFLVGNSIQTYDMSGIHQETLAISGPGPNTRRTAMTTDGNRAWFVHDPDTGHSYIYSQLFRPVGGGRTSDTQRLRTETCWPVVVEVARLSITNGLAPIPGPIRIVGIGPGWIWR